MLGNKLKTLRKNKNITQEELASALSVTYQAVSKWERNLSTPDISMLPVIARYYGITIDELMNYKLDSLSYKERFIKFLSDNGALKFGSFILGNGRVSPYEIHMEKFSCGSQIAKIGEFYAECIRDNGLRPDLLFADTYKESHIVSAVSMVLFQEFGIDISFCVENKSGVSPSSGDTVAVIKDTIATGNTVRWIADDIKKIRGRYPEYIILAVDRSERGVSKLTTIYEIERDIGVKIYSIVNVDDIITAVENRVISGYEYLTELKKFREEYRGI
ncbi:MAG: helix-turn-helix domain-containing protein [Clostridia bacterium]|nr:helix-turn-helix domain-containing protein [Clostridia bacterium]